MQNLESGKDKIKKICEILKNETLLPAKEEAQQILETAQEEALLIIRKAEQKAEGLLQQAHEKMEQEKKLFESSLQTACSQGVEALRQDIETKLFNDALDKWLLEHTANPELGAKLITVLANAIEKEGISADFSAYIAKEISPNSVNAILMDEIVKKLREKSVVVGDFIGGVQLKLHDKKLTLDLSDEAIKELLARYLRKDFRQLLFKT